MLSCLFLGDYCKHGWCVRASVSCFVSVFSVWIQAKPNKCAKIRHPHRQIRSRQRTDAFNVYYYYVGACSISVPHPAAFLPRLLCFGQHSLGNTLCAAGWRGDGSVNSISRSTCWLPHGFAIKSRAPRRSRQRKSQAEGRGGGAREAGGRGACAKPYLRDTPFGNRAETMHLVLSAWRQIRQSNCNTQCGT